MASLESRQSLKKRCKGWLVDLERTLAGLLSARIKVSLHQRCSESVATPRARNPVESKRGTEGMKPLHAHGLW